MGEACTHTACVFGDQLPCARIEQYRGVWLMTGPGQQDSVMIRCGPNLVETSAVDPVTPQLLTGGPVQSDHTSAQYHHRSGAAGQHFPQVAVLFFRRPFPGNVRHRGRQWVRGGLTLMDMVLHLLCALCLKE